MAAVVAAAVAALRDALERLDFTDAAALAITDNQGINTIAEFRLLTDDKVTVLCKTIRRPGGTIANTNAAILAGQPANIPNPGIPVSLKAENNLMLLCYFLRYKERTSREIAAADIQLEDVRALTTHKEWEENHKKDADPPEIDAKDWSKTMDAIEEYLRGCLGITKIPLAYVVRLSVEVTADPVGGWSSRLDELIGRAPIATVNNQGEEQFTQTFLVDRSRVWQLISELTRSHDCWTYVKPAQKTRDGRMAFMGLRDHYLGRNNIDNLSSRAEKKLQATTYTGEKRNWNFEKFVKVHKDQHAVLSSLTEHGYAGIDDRSKVRHLLAGIKTTAFDTVKTRIMSEATLRSDFDACVNLYQDFIEQMGNTSTVKDVTVAAVSGKPTAKGKKGGDGGPLSDASADMSVEDRYYTKAEYDKLSLEKRHGLKIKRENRGASKKKKGKGKSKRNGNQMELSERSIAALAAAISDKSGDAMDEDDNSSEASEEHVPMKPPASKKAKTGNRNNKALTRRQN